MFQLYLTIKISFMEIFQVFVTMFSKSSAADLLYVGKGKKLSAADLIKYMYLHVGKV